MRTKMLVAAALCAVVAVVPAQAAVLTFNYHVVASVFTGGAPYSPVSGDFAVTFDNAADVQTTTTGLTVSNLSIAVASPTKFAYLKSVDFLIIGTNADTGGYSITNNKNHFGLFIRDISGPNPYLDSFGYSSQAASGFFYASQFALTANTVPEPATWGLLIVGFAATGSMLRRRRALTA